jgi:hypothetical protein
MDILVRRPLTFEWTDQLVREYGNVYDAYYSARGLKDDRRREFENSRPSLEQFYMRRADVKGPAGVRPVNLPINHASFFFKFLDNYSPNAQNPIHEHLKGGRTRRHVTVDKFLELMSEDTLDEFADDANAFLASVVPYARARVHVTRINDVEFYAFERANAAEFLAQIRRAVGEENAKRNKIVLGAQTVFATEVHQLLGDARDYKMVSPPPGFRDGKAVCTYATVALFDMAVESMRAEVARYFEQQQPVAAKATGISTTFKDESRKRELPK